MSNSISQKSPLFICSRKSAEPVQYPCASNAISRILTQPLLFSIRPAISETLIGDNNVRTANLADLFAEGSQGQPGQFNMLRGKRDADDRDRKYESPDQVM